MMVLHCDRCRKVIPNIVYSSEAPRYKIKQLGTVIGPYPPDDKRIDLCHDCEKEFAQWLEMEVKE